MKLSKLLGACFLPPSDTWDLFCSRGRKEEKESKEKKIRTLIRKSEGGTILSHIKSVMVFNA